MHRLLIFILILVLSGGAVTDRDLSEFSVPDLQMLAMSGVGPSWIHQGSATIPDADLVYVDSEHWEIFVMSEDGGHKQCLTCKGRNPIGEDFPPDTDRKFPHRHWKGDPEAHPTFPIVFFKAENEHSRHRLLRNAPSIGWDNDLWALHLDDGRYYRLTTLAKGEGLQHSAMSHDGHWYVYPLRYDMGNPPADFGLARMVFNQLRIEKGCVSLVRKFEIQPLGPMYYEPFDIWQSGPATYYLTYAAGSGNILDPYRFEWTFSEGCLEDTVNTRLQQTPGLHEEFMMIAPGGEKMAWMRGQATGLKYRADLYLSDLHFSGAKRLTWFNDCDTWPTECRPYGAQLSRLSWKGDGSALFFGLWTHGPLIPAKSAAIYRLNISE